MDARIFSIERTPKENSKQMTLGLRRFCKRFSYTHFKHSTNMLSADTFASPSGCA